MVQKKSPNTKVYEAVDELCRDFPDLDPEHARRVMESVLQNTPRDQVQFFQRRLQTLLENPLDILPFMQDRVRARIFEII